MRVFGIVLLLALAVPALAAEKKAAAGKSDWHMNASVIEACSCPMFCQCYFNVQPAGHPHASHGEGEHAGAEHFCRFNNAYKVNKGNYGNVKLDGAEFWMYGDLGGDFSKGQMDWVVVTFDKATTPEQREAIGAIAAKLFPVQWNSMTTAEGDIEWVWGKEESYALLDAGKTAEVRLSAASLNRNQKAEPIVIKNLKYWGAPRNDGFIMMPNVVEAVRTGDKAFEFKGTNGFLLTLDMSSKDFAASSTPAGKGMN